MIEEKRFYVSLQMKIAGLIAALLILVIGTLTVIFAFQQLNEGQKQAEQLAVQTAKTISYMPPVKEAFQLADKYAFQNLDVIEQMKEQAGAHAVYITDQKGNVTFHSARSSIPDGNQKLQNKTVMFGGSPVSDGMKAVRGSAPVILEEQDHNEVVGTVTVEFLQDEIEKGIKEHLWNLSYFACLVLLIGIGGAAALAKSIRKDTLGLEPHEIASLYRERNAMLLAIKEGIIAVNKDGAVTMMNLSAADMLKLPMPLVGRHIEDIMPDAKLMPVLAGGEAAPNQEVRAGDKVLILNIKKMSQAGQDYGAVISFREKTELKKLIGKLTEMKKYSEDLRAQTHEFSNKLYAILGLLELGEYDEAIELIKEEYAIQNEQHEILFQNIHSQRVQAILLGKMGKASEKKVQLSIDENSFLESLPKHVGSSQMITIIGNVIDNAFEAVAEKKVRKVSFFITDIGRDIVIEVSDSGDGVPPDKIQTIFQKGYSSKGTKRGYGLANLKEAVNELQGWIEISNQKSGGAVFTVFIPKERHKGESM
ncbi:sensor histidine kinase [Bacillus sp. ISL-51]|uniref:sensor histidine kinase n=1 Tax=Bacteria TaxID=2 RepID=UPI001BE9482D|nr:MULTISPECIES: sensor histidine kinase [unclassified Bacillus (in: firmicutes)]MBT2572481.1 sensor histidine kinase [Bacillus sp. ISL-51]MBT2634416.1 sensor histidine kinase [Bacillus sp. ISL-26]